MERLTCNKLKMVCDGYYIVLGSAEERRRYRMLAEDAPKYEEIYKKLAEYENLEEKLVSHTGHDFKSWLKNTTSIFDS